MGYPITIDEQMLVSAVRYALGRQTYIVHSTSDSVRGAWQNLSLSAQAVILRDIREALEGAKAKGNTLGSDFDHRAWVDLLNDMVTGALDAPAEGPESESDPAEPLAGYPSEEELQRLAAFRGTARELVEYVESIWRNGAGTFVLRGLNHWGKAEVTASFVTGGWSGCEKIVGVLNSTLARTFASKWGRGGLHEYTFPAKVYDSDEPWDWALPADGAPEEPGPYAYVRDRLASLEAAVDERIHELADQDFRAPVKDELWALRLRDAEKDQLYWFDGTEYFGEWMSNQFARSVRPDDERIVAGRRMWVWR